MNNWSASFRAIFHNWHFRKRFYRKTLIALLIAVCLPTLVVGSGVKWIGTKQLEQIVRASRDFQVAHSARRIDDYFSYLEKAATQWAFNPDFGAKLRNLENDYDYEFIRSIFTNLLLLKDSNPLISDVYLYLDRPGAVYSGIGGAERLAEADKARFHELLDRPNATFWLAAFAFPRPDEGRNMPTLVYQLPADSARPAAALLIYLEPDRLALTLGGSTFDENGATFLFNEDGERIGSSDTTGSLSGIMRELYALVRNDGQSRGTFAQSWDNEVYSVSYTSFSRLGQSWTYVTVDSLQNLHSPVIAASNFVYAIGLVGLLIGIAAAIVASRALYKPIQSLMKLFNANSGGSPEAEDELSVISEQWRRVNFESKTLKERLEWQLPTMKEGFLLQLLQGHFQHSKRHELEERMQLFGWDGAVAGFVVFGIHIHASARAGGRFGEGDQELIAFSAINIAEELLRSSELKSEIINLHDLSIGVLLGCPSSAARKELRDELYLLAERLVHTIHRFVQIDITLCVSKQVASVIEIPAAWDEVNRIVRYRDLNESRQVIIGEDFRSRESHSIQYPFAAEAEIQLAVRNLDEHAAGRALHHFCEELKANTTNELLFQQGMLQLYGNLQFSYLKAGYNPFETASFRVQEEMEKLTEPAAIAELFQERLVKPYIDHIRQDSEKQDVRIRQAIERTIETIHAEYAADLSLDRLAEEHNLTPLTLSKSFKKWTGVNFIHYLTDIRIGKSKQLLAETDYKINDIAEMVGYQPTYFNRIFKKSEGMTPSRYREKLGASPNRDA